MSSARGLEDLVARQVRRWEMERRADQQRERSPCVALTRLRRSGADELGLRVAEQLGYGFFGSAIVDRIAGESRVQRELVEGIDERVRSAIDRYVIDFFHRRQFTENDYLRQVVHTITTLGERGAAVILGRGAAFVLPEERALRVLVVAPLEKRRERLAMKEAVSAADAARRLEREDAERIHFLRHQFGVDPDDPTRYDLVVNLGTLSVETAAGMVVESLRDRFPAA
jgi:cytidylate kinase